MCGRYTLNKNTEDLAEAFNAEPAQKMPQLFERFNISPTQPIPAVRAGGDYPELTMLRWGLVPFWADDIDIGNRMINARADKVTTSGAYKAAMKYRRCLLPADGFYEWRKPNTGKGPKQPHYIRLQDGEVFAFAGLWEHWQDEHGNELETCTLITTSPNALVSKVHDRMPVILEPDEYDQWLNTPSEDAGELVRLLDQYPEAKMEMWPVSRAVNKPQNEGPTLIDKVNDPAA